jgi:hypothetical protein
VRGLRTLGSLCAAAAILPGCSAIHGFTEGFQKSFASGFHKSFRSSFKSGFVASCTRGGASEKRCDCVGDALERKFTDDQLIKLAGLPDEERAAIAAAARTCSAQ